MKNKRYKIKKNAPHILRHKASLASEPLQQYGSDNSFEEIKTIFRELSISQKEAGKKSQENERMLTGMFQETDRKFQETDKKFQETDKKIKELATLFTGQWGKLVEALMAPGCLKLFQGRGVKIFQCFPNVEIQKNGRQMEVDLMLVNDAELVDVEIKTTARVNHIRELLNELKEFKTFFPRYADCKVYGAIAAVRFEEGCDRFAESQGLFVIKATGEGLVKITNDKKFVPKAF